MNTKKLNEKFNCASFKHSPFYFTPMVIAVVLHLFFLSYLTCFLLFNATLVDPNMDCHPRTAIKKLTRKLSKARSSEMSQFSEIAEPIKIFREVSKGRSPKLIYGLVFTLECVFKFEEFHSLHFCPTHTFDLRGSTCILLFYLTHNFL